MDKNIQKILKNIPKSSGIYQFFDKSNKIIYIGKSVNLSNRVNSYFNKSQSLSIAKKNMVSKIKNIETIITNSGTEALILESTLIKKHKPKYNILMRDDKNYTYIKITHEIIPKIIKTRIKTKTGIYFGPYISITYVNNILKLIKKIFGYRSCNISFFEEEGEKIKIKSSSGAKIPCMDYYIGRCSAPCLLENEKIKKYNNSIEKIIYFLKGNYKIQIEKLKLEMFEHSKKLNFEKSAEIKKIIETLEMMEKKQIVRDFVSGNYDIIGYIEKYNKIFISLVKLRESKIEGLQNYEIKNNLDENRDEIINFFIGQKYIENKEKINLIIPFDTNLDENIQKELNIKIETPKKGSKIDLINFAYRNALEFAYKNHLDGLSRPKFTKKISENLLNILGYKKINKEIIIECVDISHISGNHTVASRSVFKNSKSDKSKYRKFKIKTLENGKIDDFASMKEIMTRRLIEIIKNKTIPDLIVIDGGKGQLSSVLKAIEIFKGQNKTEENLKLINNLQIVSIAKREEELFIPNTKTPILLKKDTLELRLTQSLRDEAHRFAITFNRDLRIKSMKKNILEEIPGIGPKTRKKLLNMIGSVSKIGNFSIEKLSTILNKKQLESLEDHGIISN